jgi:hypothetical protein
MSTAEEIKAAIERLSLEERAELARWIHGWTDDEWDRQMKRDASSGRLDRLIADADLEMKSGSLRDLP